MFGFFCYPFGLIEVSPVRGASRNGQRFTLFGCRFFDSRVISTTYMIWQKHKLDARSENLLFMRDTQAGSESS